MSSMGWQSRLGHAFVEFFDWSGCELGSRENNEINLFGNNLSGIFKDLFLGTFFTLMDARWILEEFSYVQTEHR